MVFFGLVHRIRRKNHENLSTQTGKNQAATKKNTILYRFSAGFLAKIGKS
jgi:hypothetical protein